MKLAKGTFFVKNKKGFQFTQHKVEKIPGVLRAREETTDAEGLTGYVHGQKSSDIEERFARALDILNIPYRFQRYVPTEYTLPDQDKLVDFVVYWRDRAWPVEVYGSYFHSSAGDVLRDLERERQLDDIFRRWGWEDLQVIWDYDLYDQPAANRKAKELFT